MLTFVFQVRDKSKRAVKDLLAKIDDLKKVKLRNCCIDVLSKKLLKCQHIVSCSIESVDISVWNEKKTHPLQMCAVHMIVLLKSVHDFILFSATRVSNSNTSVLVNLFLSYTHNTYFGISDHIFSLSSSCYYFHKTISSPLVIFFKYDILFNFNINALIFLIQQI